jgi:hypothetical protein
MALSYTIGNLWFNKQSLSNKVTPKKSVTKVVGLTKSVIQAGLAQAL